MTVSESLPRTYPAEDWLRTITFTDRAEVGPEEVPVHVACGPILLNGENRGDVRIPKGSFAISGGHAEPTRVEFDVDAGSCQIGAVEDGQVVRHWTIGGLRCIVPLDGPWVAEEEDGLVHVVVYVAEVHFQ